MKKIKRMTFDELEKVYLAIDKEEQKLYTGGYHWKIDNASRNGFTQTCVDSHCTLYDIITINGYDKKLPFGTIARSREGISKSTAITLFELCANNSKLEWGMTIESTGNARVYTDGIGKSVTLTITNNTTQLVHSHHEDIHDGDETSPEDREIANNNRQIKHTLYYDGKYRDFGYKGFYGGDWRPTLDKQKE